MTTPRRKSPTKAEIKAQLDSQPVALNIRVPHKLRQALKRRAIELETTQQLLAIDALQRYIDAGHTPDDEPATS